MKISYPWLQDYFKDSLPPQEKVAEILTMKAYEVEGISDSVLDIDILPNRSSDSLSYLGVAKEVAVLLDQDLELSEIKFETDNSQKTSDFIALKVEDPKLTIRAMKRVVLDVKVEESPDWLKEKLASMGQKSINNIVDITNFVMWETGQPVHAFDLDKIKEGEISIRGAKEGEKITTLDRTEYELRKGMLVISDSEKALDIAGIKGGIVSGIDLNTKRVMLSVCNFNPTWIRKTSRALNLRTDASQRFENGITPAITEPAMERLSQLVSEIAGGKVLREVLDNYPRGKNRTSAPYKIGVSLNEINKRLGSEMSESEVEEILNRFQKHAGFRWQKVNPLKTILDTVGSLEGVPYKYGASITYDAPNLFDCSSFVNYIYVQGGVVLPRMTVDQFVFGTEIEESDLKPGDLVFSRNSSSEEEHIERLEKNHQTLHRESKEFMAGTEVPDGLDHNGLYLGNGKIIHAAGNWHMGKVVVEDLKKSPAFKEIVGYRRVINSEEERYVVEIPPERLDLRAGSGFMVGGNKEDIIEEISRVYGYKNISSKLPEKLKLNINQTFYYVEKIKDLMVKNGFSEVITYSFQNEGSVKIANPLSSDKKYLRSSLRLGLQSALELNNKNKPLFGSMGVKFFEIGKVFEKEEEYLSLGVVTEDKDSMNSIRLELEEILDEKANLENNILTIDMRPEKLPNAKSYDDLSTRLSETNGFQKISYYPFVLRDIAFWTTDGVDVGELEKIIGDTAGNLLININLFDTYEKEGKVSYAFNLVFQSEDKTLTDKEIGGVMKNIESKIEQNGWTVR